MNKKDLSKDPLYYLKKDLDKANNFIDYFLVCGVKPSLCLDEALYEIESKDSVPNLPIQPEILTKCPSFDKSLVNIDEGILSYCFLSKFQIISSPKQPPNELFSFILDNNFFSIEYPQKYVTCLVFYESIYKYSTLKEKIRPKTPKPRMSRDITSQSVIMPEMDKMTEMTTDSRASFFSSNNPNSKYKTLYIPKAICLVSIYPFITEHQKILKCIYRYTSIKQPKPIEKMILNLIIEIPVPPRGVTSVEYQIVNEKIPLARREFNKLPYADFDMEVIYTVFTSEHILIIFNHLLLETKIIFFSKDVNNLFNMILGILHLLYPFKYPFQVASYVQQQNYAIIESISPYILGINQSYTDDFFSKNNIEISEMSILIVDIDKATTVLKATEEFPMLPKSFANKLDKEVQAHIALGKEDKSKKNLESIKDSFCASFFRFIVNIMKNYAKYLNIDYYTSNDNIQNTNINTLFKGADYVQSFSSCDQPFIEKFVNEAQMFSDFIYKRMIPKDNKEKLEILFLDESISDNRRTLFHKRDTIFTSSTDYDIKNKYIALQGRTLNNSELESFQIEENRVKSLTYGQEVIIFNKSINFNYILFPMFNNEIFCNEISLSDYNLPPCLLDEVEAINTDIVSKSNLSLIKVQSVEMENYIYLTWLQLWAFSFGYLDEKEEEFRFDQMLKILDRVTHHEIEVFNLIFETLKKKEKTQMIIRLYQKLIIYKINPSSYIYSIIYKLIDKNQIKSLTVNPNTSWTDLNAEAKQSFRERTIKSRFEEFVIGERVKFYTRYICIQCQSVIDLEKISKDFVNMKRDIMWAYCSECDECILPKLRVRFGVEYNFGPHYEGQTSTVDEVVLHSPYHLKVNIKEGIFREYGILLDINDFKKKFTALFWNSVWYFRLIGLDYTFLFPYVKNIPHKLQRLRRKIMIKSDKPIEVKPKEIRSSKRERFTELEISKESDDTSFELTNRVMTVIGGSIEKTETKDSLFSNQSINMLDNTLLPSDTASSLSEDNIEVIPFNKLQRDSLNLEKIEEEVEEAVKIDENNLTTPINLKNDKDNQPIAPINIEEKLKNDDNKLITSINSEGKDEITMITPIINEEQLKNNQGKLNTPINIQEKLIELGDFEPDEEIVLKKVKRFPFKNEQQSIQIGKKEEEEEEKEKIEEDKQITEDKVE